MPTESMAESALNHRLVKALKAYHPVRVENSVCPGTPDIECTLGWIENKFLDHWPRQGIVKIDHYTPQQRVWAIRRSRATGPGRGIWFCLQVDKEVLLFRGEVAAEFAGKCDEATLRSKALQIWNGTLDGSQLIDVLLKDIYMPDGF